MDNPNLPCLPIVVLGSSLSRRMELVQKVWNIIKEESEFSVKGMLVDAPPKLFNKTWLDFYIREGVVINQEMSHALRLSHEVADTEDACALLFSVYSGYSFFVDRLIDKDDRIRENASNKLLGADGEPLAGHDEKLGLMLAFNGFNMAQTILASAYDGFWVGGSFLLGSDEPDADVVTQAIPGSSELLKYPNGSMEQMRHYYAKFVVDSFGIPAVELQPDIDVAARTMANGLMYRFGLKELPDES